MPHSYKGDSLYHAWCIAHYIESGIRRRLIIGIPLAYLGRTDNRRECTQELKWSIEEQHVRLVAIM